MQKLGQRNKNTNRKFVHRTGRTGIFVIHAVVIDDIMAGVEDHLPVSMQ